MIPLPLPRVTDKRLAEADVLVRGIAVPIEGSTAEPRSIYFRLKDVTFDRSIPYRGFWAFDEFIINEVLTKVYVRLREPSTTAPVGARSQEELFQKHRPIVTFVSFLLDTVLRSDTVMSTQDKPAGEVLPGLFKAHGIQIDIRGLCSPAQGNAIIDALSMECECFK